MKKVILLAILTLTASSYGMAQRLSVIDGRLDKLVLAISLDGPTMATLEMQQELSLNQEQYTEVERLNLERYAKMRQAEEEHADDPVLRSKTIFNITMQNAKALEAVLNDEQLQQYLQLEGTQNIHFVSEGQE